MAASSPAESKERPDALGEDPACISTQVANDHDVIKGLYRQFKAPSLSDAERQRVVWEMIRTMCIHLYAEEEVICPVLGKEVGAVAKEHALDVDKSLKLILSDIDNMKVGNDGLGAKIEQLMEVFFMHLTEEEHIMPKLQASLGADQMKELGRKFKAAKDHVPTRPHPSAPDSILVHIATAPIDYIRDRWRFG